MNCPLCSFDKSSLFDRDKQRRFYQCDFCSLVFVDRDALITASQEKKRYEAHENSEDDSGYVKYLSSIKEAIKPHLKQNSVGLDFGSGRTKVLEKLLNEEGHEVISFDIYFHPDVNVHDRTYDFIVMSEVIEHLRDLRRVLSDLTKLLRPDGMLFVKTKLVPENFSNWFYKRDITHIQFFSEESFEVLSKAFGLSKAEGIFPDLYLFRNNGRKVG